MLALRSSFSPLNRLRNNLSFGLYGSIATVSFPVARQGSVFSLYPLVETSYRKLTLKLIDTRHRLNYSPLRSFKFSFSALPALEIRARVRVILLGEWTRRVFAFLKGNSRNRIQATD